MTFKKNIYCAFKSQLKDAPGCAWKSLSPPGLGGKMDTGARF